MARSADWWEPPDGDPAGAAWAAYDALQRLRSIDLRRVRDPHLRVLVRSARASAERAYTALWDDPALSRLRRADFEARRTRWLAEHPRSA